MSSLRVRHSIQYIQHLYNSGEDRSKLENIIQAFLGIQALPPDKLKSFFLLPRWFARIAFPWTGSNGQGMVWRVLLAWHCSVPYLASHSFA